MRARTIDDENVHGDELAQFCLVAVVEARVLEGLEHLISAQGEDGMPPPAGRVAQRVREEGFAHAIADRAEVALLRGIRSMVQGGVGIWDIIGIRSDSDPPQLEYMLFVRDTLPFEDARGLVPSPSQR